MIIRSVFMKNFRSHAETTVRFGSGINVILGENGSGKTSILEAISFGLFKDYTGSMESLVRNGHREMVVEVTFTSHGNAYKVVRRRTKSTTDARLFLLDGGEKEIRRGDTGVDEEIAAILGIDRYLFSNAIYVRQGEIENLLTETAHKKKQLVAKLLGIDSLERVWESMRHVIETYRERKAVIEGRIMRADELEKEEEGLSSEISEVEERMKKTAAVISARKAETASLEERESKAAEKQKLYSAADARREELERFLSQEKMRVADAEKEVQAAGAFAKEAEALRRKIPDNWKVSLDKRISGLRNTMSVLDTEQGSIQSRITDISEWKSRLEGAKGACPLCGAELTETHRNSMLSERKEMLAALRKKAAELSLKREKVSKELQELYSEKEELLALEKRYTELSGQASGYMEAEQRLTKGRKSLAEAEKKLKALLKELKTMEPEKNAYEALKAKLKESRSEMEALSAAYERQKGRLESLKESMKRLSDEKKQIKGMKAEHEKLARFIKTLNEIRAVFDKSGLQLELRKRAMPLIEQYMREFFREFNFEYSDISLDENYDVTLYGSGGEMTAGMISGGERIASALALRLGISKALASSNAETVLLDEPTIFLDEQRRQDLIEVLKKTDLLPQMIVVTHDNAMEDAADSIVMIVKKKGISMVERE